MSALAVAIGFLVSTLVFLTGIGGGIILLPLLIQALHVPPLVAVGSSAAFMFLTKLGSAALYASRRRINWSLGFAMAYGSIPSALLGVAMIVALRSHFGSHTDDLMKKIIGVVLCVIPALAAAISTMNKRLASRLERRSENQRWAILVGAAGGLLVGCTSIGSGSLIMMLLLLIYNMPMAVLVGTDIFHAVLLTGVLSLVQWKLGMISFPLLGSLIIGFLPGLLLGSVLSEHLHKTLWIRRALLLLVAACGVQMVFL